MLRAVHGNRVEELFSALDEALPPADPFAPSTIIVGSKLVARWLTRELAVSRGVAAGLELVTFDDFVKRTWAADGEARAAGLSPLDRGRLGAALASVLADDTLVRGLPAVAGYLSAAPAQGDRAGPRRVQLAEHLADLTWAYALTRPDWMPALLVGRVPSDLEGDPTARWQAALIGAAMARLDGRSLQDAHGERMRWAPLPMLPWLRRRAKLPPPQPPGPVAAFGMSFLARGQLEALTDLSATTDVTVYILDPCEELWDDVSGRAGRNTLAASIDPLPLILWGRPVRDTIAALVERTGGDIDGRFIEDDLPPEVPLDARQRLLSDVRTRRPASGEIAHAAGVTVLACPNARREIEVIAGEARRRLDEDPSLSAHEIAVWIAGDAEEYLAQAPSAFEAVGVPCHLIDAPIDDRGRIGEAVLALLELPTGTMTRRELLRAM
ncbi:MAG TPA: exodeoxyribonuclease V subunit gamma, partial [Kofleriaceae bacterium]|nr:exodeoxyribonuclease V subunit gamma [Kofleriaceae bacterium]